MITVALCLLTAALPAAISAADQATNPLPSLSGITGLLDMPSARLMDDWHLRFHSSWGDPYGTVGLTATFLPWLEINGRFIQVSGVPGFREGNYGDYKDKALDVKFRLHEETLFWPALALGGNDIHGTGLFTSRYLAANKQFGPLDITLGLGQGILAGESTAGTGSAGSAAEDAAFSFIVGNATTTRVFGGLELQLTDRVSLLAEYSSLDYEELIGQAGPASIPLNFGTRWRVTDKIMLSASYLRGDLFSCGLAFTFPFGPEGMLPWKKRPYWTPAPALIEETWAAGNDRLAEILQREVTAEHFTNVRAAAGRQGVWLEFENPTYLSNIKAMGRVLRAVRALVPPRIEKIAISLKTGDIIVVTMRIGRQDFQAFVAGNMSDEQLACFIELDNAGNELRWRFLLEEPDASPLTPSLHDRWYALDLQPKLVTLINDPSGFARSRLSMLGGGAWFPWSGGTLAASLQLPLYNDIGTSNTVQERDAVRTDFIAFEQQTDPRLDSLLVDQVFYLPGQWLARLAAGLFEPAYGGVGGELFRFFGAGRFGLGLEGEWVKKRDLDNYFSLPGSTSHELAFLNLYYKVSPEYGVDIGLKLGRFLAGDWGGRLEVSRTFKHCTIGAWYTVTKTDIFEASYNQGYNDKGVYLTIPFSIFKDRDVPRKLNYAIRPWTRDPGQTVAQHRWLYPMANEGNISTIERSLGELRD
jgi:hypothetical protein